MGSKLGKNQLQRLLGLASPSSLLVVGDKLSATLVRRGLLKPKDGTDRNAWLQITQAGMRVLADAFEAGLLEQFFKWPPGLAKPSGARDGR
jgi:hypothetical protein